MFDAYLLAHQAYVALWEAVRAYGSTPVPDTLQTAERAALAHLQATLAALAAPAG